MTLIEKIIRFFKSLKLLVDYFIGITNRIIFTFERSKRCQNLIIYSLVQDYFFKRIKSTKLLQFFLILDGQLVNLTICQIA